MAERKQVYHISKRAEDGKWQVFLSGSDKVIKLFATKKEAEEYTQKMAENTGRAIVAHNSKGENKGKAVSKTKKK